MSSNKISKKKRALLKKLKDGEISPAEMQQRLAQSRKALSDVGIPPTYIDRLTPYTSSGYKKAYNMYLLTLAEPDRFMSHIPDVFTIFPTATDRIVTRFTVSPDAGGNIAFRIYPRRFKGLGIMVAGTAIVGGTSFTGPSAQFEMYKYSTFVGASLSGRLIGCKVEVRYVGGTLVNSGTHCISALPPFRNGSAAYPGSYDELASYQYSHRSPVKEGCYQIYLPTSNPQTTTFVDMTSASDVITDDSISYFAKGVNVTGTPPTAEDRIEVVVTQVAEFHSVDPILTAKLRGSSPNAINHANEMARVIKANGLDHGPVKKHNTVVSRLGNIIKGASKYVIDHQGAIWDFAEKALPIAASIGAALL
jgi:hypothetical protein